MEMLCMHILSGNAIHFRRDYYSIGRIYIWFRQSLEQTGVMKARAR